MGKKSKRSRSKKGALPNSSKTKEIIRRGEFTATDNIEGADAIRYYRSSIKSQLPEDIVAKIGKGANVTTTALSQCVASEEFLVEEKAHLQGLIDSGLVGVVTKLLNRVDERVEDIVGKGGTAMVDGKPVSIILGSGEEGIVLKPSIWITLLAGLLFRNAEKCLSAESIRSSRVEVARGIGSLTKLMCDDMKRMCFRENSHWHQCYGEFVELLVGLVCARETVPILADYDGLFASLVQCMFWQDYRPDIVKESKVHGCSTLSNIRFNAGELLREAMCTKFKEPHQVRGLDADGRSFIRSIGSETIVNLVFDPTCEVTFLHGLLSLLKSPQDPDNPNNKRSLQNLVTNLASAGVTSKSAIKALLKIGHSHTATRHDACLWSCMALEMINEPDLEDFLDETLTTYAIKHGIYSVVVKLLGRFGACRNVVGCAHRLVACIHVASSRLKISRAIKSLLADTELLDELNSLEEAAQMTNNGELMNATMAMRSSIALKGHTPRLPKCSNCKKTLEQSEIRYCSRCNTTGYCSRECQMAHWKEHKQNCIKAAPKHAKRRSKEQEEAHTTLVNILTSQSRSLLMEALVQGMEIQDCYIFISLHFVPHEIMVLQCGSSEEKKKLCDDAEPHAECFRLTTGEKAIDLVRQVRRMVSECADSVCAVVFSQLGVNMAATNLPWKEDLRKITHDEKDRIAYLQKNPDEQKAFVEKLRLKRIQDIF